jgi:uncharacterized SAM-binding protein YcdF (DUF218 family)
MAERSGSPLLLAVAGGAVCGGLLGGALLVGVCRSGWAPWIIGAAALAALVVLAAVPLSVLGLAATLVHPRGRGWLAEQAAQHLERRHAVRLAAAQQVREQHLHVGQGAGGGRGQGGAAPHVEVLPGYRELPG